MKYGDYIKLSKVLSLINLLEGLVYLRKRVIILLKKIVKSPIINVELEPTPGFPSE
jgi:hypothetical protein